MIKTPLRALAHVDLLCQGETDEAWLFHGRPGSPIQHLALDKGLLPERVAWVRVLLDIHLESEERPDQKTSRLEQPTKKRKKESTRGRTKSS